MKTTPTENWKPLDFQCPYACTYCPEEGYSETPRLRERWEDIPSRFAIWVCPDTDLFCDEVPSGLIESILEKASDYPHYPHKAFIFCTRNVERYSEFLDKFPQWTYFATTVESDIDHGCSRAPPPMVRLEELKKLKFALSDLPGIYETCISIKPIMNFTDKFADIIRHVMPDQVSIGREVMCIENFPTPRFSEVLTLAKKLSRFTSVNVSGEDIKDLEDWPQDDPPERFKVKRRRYLHAAIQVERQK